MADLQSEEFFPNPSTRSELDLAAFFAAPEASSPPTSSPSTSSAFQTPAAEPVVATIITEPATTTATVAPIPVSPSRFTFFSRVTKSFPAINTLSGRATEFYNSVKNLSPTIKTGLDTVESTLDKQLAAHEDILVKVDAFGTRQFEKVEELVHSHPLETLKPSALTQTLTDRVVAPASSALSQKLDVALAYTERKVDAIVGPEPAAEYAATTDAATTVQPTHSERLKTITSRVSNHVKSTVVTSLNNNTIRIRSAQQVKQLKANSVDLIKYFHEQIAVVSPSSVKAKLQEESGRQLERGLTAYNTASNVVKQGADRASARVAAARERANATMSRLVSQNLKAVSLSEKLQPYLLYANTLIPSVRSFLAAKLASVTQKKTKSESENPETEAELADPFRTIGDKIAHAEFKINTHTDGSNSLEISVPLPSVTQLKFLLSQHTLKLAVERMLELIAKPHLLTRQKPVAQVPAHSDSDSNDERE